jgi:hypothetical protein
MKLYIVPLKFVKSETCVNSIQIFNTSMKESCYKNWIKLSPNIGSIGSIRPQPARRFHPSFWAFPAEFAGVHLGQFAAWATSFPAKTLDHVNGAQVVLVKQEARDEQSDGWLF